MRHKQKKLTPVNSKIIMMTGGLKQDVSQLELKGGDLIGCQNYQEIDGVFHGYSSIKGYERYDGQAPASSIAAPFMEDKGINGGTAMDLESGSALAGTAEYSTYEHPYVLTNIIEDTQNPKFGLSNFYFQNLLSNITIDHNVVLNVGATDFTIDFLLQLPLAGLDAPIMEKATNWKIDILNERLVFSYSTDGLTYTDTFTSSSLISSNTEYHVAFIQINNIMHLFLNGVLDEVGTLMASPIDTSSTADLVLGGGLRGWMDQIRISDEYMWHADFTPPLEEYSTVGYYTTHVDDLAREAQRELIEAPPGEGPIRAVAVLGGDVGAIRDEVGETGYAGAFRSSPTGWGDSLPGSPIIHFINGKDVSGTGFQDGDTITGSISGASATLLHHNLLEGEWTGVGTAHGILVMDTEVINPPFVLADELSNGSGATADVEPGEEHGITEFRFLAGGVYDVTYAAFDKLAGNQREKLVYQANGLNFPSYFNNDRLIPIIHENLPDSHEVFATSIIEFKNRLWLGYPDGRLWYSGVGDPYEWDTATGGAGEIYLEDEITNLIIAPGDVLMVFCRNSTQIIKTIADAGAGVTAGTVADYAFFNETFSKRSGAIYNTSERLLGDVYFLDDRGLTNLSTTDAYGDFSSSAISKNVQRSLISKKDLVVTSALQREFNQYRLYFSDKSGFIFTFDEEKKVKGITQLKYKHQMSCFGEGEDLEGNLVLVMGTDEGYLMLMDSGTSFDGETIETFLTPAYYSYSTSTTWKRFRKVTFEMQADRGLILHGRPDFNYREANMPKSVELFYELYGSGGVYGADAWGDFRWSAGTEQPVMYLTGYGSNMSLTLSTSNKYTKPHTINSMIIEYSRHARKQ